MFSPAPIIQSLLKKKNKHTDNTHNVYPCKPQFNYIKVEFEAWGEGLDNIRRLGWCILKHTYAKERTMGMDFWSVRKIPTYGFLRFFIVVTNLGNITYWDRFWIFNTKPI